MFLKQVVCIALGILGIFNELSAQNILNDKCDYNTRTNPWYTEYGDGELKAYVEAKENFIRFQVDATQEPYNVWWATVKRSIPFKPNTPQDYSQKKLWIEAKVKPSHAIRRLNMRLYNQRTTDHHEYLKEFDLSDTVNWHTIRFSPAGLRYLPGDQLTCHLALIDWGNQKFHLDIKDVKVFFGENQDRFRESDNALVYHPEPKPIEDFENQLPIQRDAMLDLAFPNRILKGWGKLATNGDYINLLSVSHNLIPILAWDFTPVKEHLVEGWGLLRLKINTSSQVKNPEHEFGRIRIHEIIGGKNDWDKEKLTFNNFSQGLSLWNIINEQMVIDMDVPKGNDRWLDIPLSPIVIQRLINGKSKGLAILPLGSIQVSFYTLEAQRSEYVPTLYFN